MILDIIGYPFFAYYWQKSMMSKLCVDTNTGREPPPGEA